MQPVRPILTLVTQTLRTPGALHGELPDVVNAIDDLSLDLEYHAKTPALRQLAATLREHAKALSTAVDAEGELPREWAKAVGELPDLDQYDADSAADITEVAALRKFIEKLRPVIEEAALLRELQEEMHIVQGTETHKEVRDWFRDVSAQVTRAHEIVKRKDQAAASDADVLSDALDIAENAVEGRLPETAQQAQTTSSQQVAALERERNDLARQLDAATQAVSDQHAVLVVRERERDQAQAALRSVIEDAGQLLAHARAGLPTPPESPAPAVEPPLPVHPDHMRIVGAAGLAADGPFGRILTDEIRSVALLSQDARYQRPAVSVLCAPGRGHADVEGLAGTLRGWLADRTADRHVAAPPDPRDPAVAYEGSVRKLPKPPGGVWRIDIVTIPGEPPTPVHFAQTLVRLACFGASDVCARVFCTGEDREGKPTYVLRIERNDGFVAFVMSRGAP